MLKISLEESIMSYTVLVDTDKCTGCGECIDICPVNVYEMSGDKCEAIAPEECVGCESCTGVCEFDALTIDEV